MSTSPIFAEFAPAYWERNLSVIPIENGTKRPVKDLGNWAGYCNNLPSVEKRQVWLKRFAGHNLGLLTNMEVKAGHHLGAIDVDRDELVPVVRAILGEPPCGKRGAKGATFFALVRRSSRLKKTSIRNHAGEQAIDILLGNSVTVVPPSVHPDTGQPYSWLGKPLIECSWDELPVLDDAVMTILKLVVGSEFTPILLGGTDTHDAGLRLSAALVAKGADDELISSIFRGLLPADYSGNSLHELPDWISSARAKGFYEPQGRMRVYDPGEDGPVPLGFTREGLYALRDPVRSIILTASANQLLSQQWLLGLAPSSFWRERYPAQKSPFSAATAGEALIAACKQKGPFSPQRVRGRGVWIENGQIILNLGGQIPAGLQHHYLCFEPIPLEASAQFDTARLLRLLQQFRWRDPHHALLLLGWLAIAPICGVLSWRPHCFIYGPPKAGKSTLHTLASRILHPLAVATTGDSSEAGIRQSVGPDSLPVIIDEFESDQRRGRQQAIVMLARSASSGDVPVLRGTPEGKAMQFSLRVTFFFGGINPAGLSPADASRILLLELLMHENDEEVGRLIASEVAYFATLGPRWCAYMAGQALEILPAKETFERAMPGMDARLRMNIATLLAGAFVALHRRPPTHEEAVAQVADFAATTTQHEEDVDRDDAFECLHHLFAHLINGVTVGQWLARALHADGDGRDRQDSERVFIYCGIVGGLPRNGSIISSLRGALGNTQSTT